MVEGTLLIRADANVARGTGHVMRCLALAQAWQDCGGRSIFALAETAPSLEWRLQNEGIEVKRIVADPGTEEDAKETAHLASQCKPNWIVVDGYHFGADYQSAIKAWPCKLLMVDDAAQADHYYADLILNQNPPASEQLYAKREPYTRLLLGPRYAMLRREFRAWRQWRREIPAIGRKVLISMGGSDPDNVTLPVIEALDGVRIEGLEVTVVLGGSNPHIVSAKHAAAQFSGALELRQDVSNMPELMAWADMAVIAAGGTLWELLFMGCAVLSYARDAVQGRILSELQRDGLVGDLKGPKSFDAVSLSAAIEDLAGSFDRRTRMSLMGRERVDGRGAERICELLKNWEVRNPRE